MEQTDRRGVFESGIYFKNSIADYGRLIVSDQDTARIGLDFNSTLFKEGAVKLKSEQVGTGIIYNDGTSGEIYGGKRWSETDDKNDWLTLRAGEGGIRIVSNDNTKELVSIDNNEGIYLNGDVYVNGKKMYAKEPSQKNKLLLCAVFGCLLVLLCVFIVILYKKLQKLNRELQSIKNQIA